MGEFGRLSETYIGGVGEVGEVVDAGLFAGCSCFFFNGLVVFCGVPISEEPILLVSLSMDIGGPVCLGFE